MEGKLQDIDISISDIYNLRNIRKKIKRTAVQHVSKHPSSYTLECPLSNGMLQLSFQRLPRGLIFIVDDNNVIRWIIKVTIDSDFIRLSNPLSLTHQHASWLDPKSPDYKIICGYVSNFLRECLTITEFNISESGSGGSVYSLIDYIGYSIYLK